MIRRLLLTLLLCLLSAAVAASDGISVSQSIDRFQVPFEDSLHFEIVLQWSGPQSAYLFTAPLSPSFERMKARGVTTSVGSTGSGPDEVTTKRFSYTLVPTASGQGRIDPVTIAYITWSDSLPGELITEVMTVQIAEPLPPTEESGSTALWLLIAGLVVLLAAATLGLIKWKVTRKPRMVEKTPAQQVLGELTALKSEAGTELKKFQSGLYKIIVTFLSQQYGINSNGVPDDRIEELLAATDLTDNQKRQLSRWLIQAKRDKFRPVAGAPGETVRLENEIRKFFENM